MKPHHASRRSLLGGLLAGLFGWLQSEKVIAGQPQPQPALESFLPSTQRDGFDSFE